MIPVNEPLFNGNEKKYLNECIDTRWISSQGPFVNKFEKAFANFIGVDYGVSVVNGTAALETALFALGVEKDDEVIMPSFTIKWISWFSLPEVELPTIFTPTVSEISQNRLHYYFRLSCSSENGPSSAPRPSLPPRIFSSPSESFLVPCEVQKFIKTDTYVDISA